MKGLLKAIAAAAISGAVAAGAAVSVDAGDLKGSLAKLGVIAGTGALTAIVHLFVKAPSLSE